MSDLATSIARQAPPAAARRRELTRLPRLLCARTFVVALLAMLLGVCIAGVVIPQQGTPSHAHWASRHPAPARLAAWTGLDHAFSSALFLALVALAGASVTVSVASRLGALVPDCPARGLLPHLLSRRRLLGSLLFHAGLVGLLVAGAVSALTRSEGKVVLTEGQEVTLDEALLRKARAPRVDTPRQAPFGLRLRRFHPVHDGRWGTPDYASDLTVLEEGRETRTVTVRVNEPLVHRGVTLYQTLHGFSTLLVLADAQGRPKCGSWVALGTDLTSSPVRYRDEFVLPGTRLAVKAEFFPDACVQEGRLISRSPEPRSPALDVTVREGAETLYCGLVCPGQPVELGDGLRLSLAGVRYWSGFDTVRDRGAGALFVSAWVAVAGLCVRFAPGLGRRAGAASSGRGDA